jgi:hypothetical protein
MRYHLRTLLIVLALGPLPVAKIAGERSLSWAK